MTGTKLYNVLKEGRGVIKVSQAKSNGISHASILREVQSGRLKRVAHGIYEAVNGSEVVDEAEVAEEAKVVEEAKVEEEIEVIDDLDDKLYIFQLRRPKVIYSHDTALYLNNMIDRKPSVFSVTVPTGYNTKRLMEDGATVFSIKDGLYRLGIIEVVTNLGHTITAYGPERTICDCIRSRSRMDMEVVTDAIKGYVKNRNHNRNVYLLMETAKAFGVQKILRTYLEVLM